MPELEEYCERLLELLEEQPAEFSAAVRGAPSSSEVHQLMAHVRDLEVLALAPRLRRVLTEDSPHLEAFPSHHWSAEHYRADEPLADILNEFARTRAELVNTLRSLSPEDWARVGFHPPSGRRAALWWAERTLNHAREHLEEIRKSTIS